jgi:hypothetical protein
MALQILQYLPRLLLQPWTTPLGCCSRARRRRLRKWAKGPRTRLPPPPPPLFFLAKRTAHRRLRPNLSSPRLAVLGPNLKWRIKAVRASGSFSLLPVVLVLHSMESLLNCTYFEFLHSHSFLFLCEFSIRILVLNIFPSFRTLSSHDIFGFIHTFTHVCLYPRGL